MGEAEKTQRRRGANQDHSSLGREGSPSPALAEKQKGAKNGRRPNRRRGEVRQGRSGMGIRDRIDPDIAAAVTGKTSGGKVGQQIEVGGLYSKRGI